jgi:hypothetical protein
MRCNKCFVYWRDGGQKSDSYASTRHCLYINRHTHIHTRRTWLQCSSRPLFLPNCEELHLGVVILHSIYKSIQVIVSLNMKETKLVLGPCWQPKLSILWSCQNVKETSPLCSSHRDGQKTYMERLIRSPDEGVNYPLTLCGNQNFWPPTRTSEFRIEVLTLREHQNLWLPTRTSGFRSPNQGESKLDPNSSELVGNL